MSSAWSRVAAAGALASAGWATAGGASVSGCGGSGCTKDSDCKADRVCNAGLCEEPARAPSSGSAASVPPPSPGGSIASRDVREGWLPGERFVPRFSASRVAGDAGLAFVAAAARCQARGLAVCTEAQLERACALEPSFGEVESWTRTFHATGMVVRGPGCAVRRTAHATDAASSRGAPCCSRAIAVVTDGRGAGWLESTGKKLSAYEGALAKGSAELLPLLAPKVKVHRLELAAALVAAKVDGAPAGAWSLLDTCTLSVDGGADTWTADCAKLTSSGAALTGVLARLVWSGEAGVLLRLQEQPGTSITLAP